MVWFKYDQAKGMKIVWKNCEANVSGKPKCKNIILNCCIVAWVVVLDIEQTYNHF